MSRTPLLSDFAALKGKTIVVTGGAQGIGGALVALAAKSGCNVVFGDLDAERGQQVARETGATFVKTDVVSYTDQLSLFEEALSRFGSVDHAAANAGIYEPKGPFSLSLDLESVKKEPSIPVVDINIKSVILFAHIASVYLRQNSAPSDLKSITVVSSTAGVMCPGDTPVYNATKAGLLGLVRTLAQTLPKTHGININAICPSMTLTRLVNDGLYPIWKGMGLPVNSPADIGKAILTVAAGGMNRKILYVEGGQAWDIDRPMMELVPQWIGDGPWNTLQQVPIVDDILGYSPTEKKT